MFARISPVKVGGKTYKYLRLVESYRDDNGRNKQRVIANLGRLDQLGDSVDRLVENLRRFCHGNFVLPEEIINEESVSWGEILVARKLWEDLGLGEIVEELCQGEHEFNVAERAFVLVANRLSAPTSEHGLARWLECTYVCDREGKRYVPEWLPEEQVTKEQRVKVTWNWLQKWYRTLDAVYAKKKEIEKQIYFRLMDLCQINVDIVFYDITTIYFERRSPVGKLRRHGKNKDGKPRNVQVLIGTVMLHGLPIATHVFEGNRSEKKTVKAVVEDIRNRFGIRNIIFVGDAGMKSPENIELFDNLEGYSYILGHPGRRDGDAESWLKKATGHWEECGGGTRIQEVESGKEGVRVFVAESDERKEYERALREKSMRRAEEHLKKVAKAVETGRLKDPAKIGARAARALGKDKGYRYFAYEVPGEGQFRYYLDEEKLSAETLHEGRYLITSDHPHISARDALHNYKDLSDVEDGYRHLKDIIKGRPVYHKKDERIAAHLFISHLALLAMRYLRKRLEQAGLPFSPHDALKAARSLGVATLDLNGEKKVLAAGAKRDAKRVFNALGIKELQPPDGSHKPEPGLTLFEM